MTIGDMAPQTPVGSGTTTPVPTSTPRPSGGSRLHSSDPTSNKRYTHEGNLHNSFTGIVGQVEQQNLTGAESGPKTSRDRYSTPTFETTKFYPGRFLSEIKEQVHHQLLWKLHQKLVPTTKYGQGR